MHGGNRVSEEGRCKHSVHTEDIHYWGCTGSLNLQDLVGNDRREEGTPSGSRDSFHYEKPACSESEDEHHQLPVYSGARCMGTERKRG